MTISLVGQASASATTVTLPAHQTGDLIIISARRANNTPASLPAGWTNILSATGTGTLSIRTGRLIATGSGHTSGTWSNASHLIASVWRSDSGTLSVGASAETGSSSSSNLTYPAATLTDASGRSAIYRAGSRGTGVAAVATPPTSYTLVTSVPATPVLAAHRRLAQSASPASQTVAMGSAAAVRGHTVEIVETLPAVTGSVAAVESADTLAGDGTAGSGAAAVTPVGSLAFDDAAGADASVDVPDGAGTDLEVAFCGSNHFTIDSGTDLQPSGGGWSLRHTVDRGTNDSKIRIWTRTAPAGAHTVTLSTLGGEEIWLAIRRLAGADLIDPVIDVDGATAADGSHTAPALTLGSETGYLLGAAMSAVFEGGSTYTPPAGFTELADFDLQGSAAHATVAEDQSATGSVGPFTFAYSAGADPGLAAVIAIRPAGSGITGALASDEAGDTLAGSGTATPPPITGSLAATESADTLAAGGTATPPGFTGTLAATELADTLVGSGTATPPAFAGTVVATETPDTLVAAGTFTLAGVTGTLAATEAADTLAAAGTHTPPGVAGTLAVSEAGDTVAGSGTAASPSFTAMAAVTEGADTLAAAGEFVIPGTTGAIAAAELGDTLAAGGVVDNSTVVGPTPAERVYAVAADSRVFTVEPDPRTYVVAADPRLLRVGAESRTYLVAAEERTVHAV